MKNTIRKIIREELKEIKYISDFADIDYTSKKFDFLKQKIDDDNENFDYSLDLSPYETRVFNTYMGYLVALYDKGELFLIVDLYKFRDGVKIDDLRSTRQKTGIGVPLYNSLAQTFGALYSDTLQYEASKRIWDKIIKNSPERVFVYNRKTKEEQSIQDTDNNIIYRDEDIILKLIK